MKKFLYLIALVMMATLHSYAQNTPFANGVKLTALPIVYLPEDVSVHFISPEPIQYVDISTKNIVGDIPVKNVLRIKLRDSLKSGVDAIVTIVGESFIAQYHVVLADAITSRDARTDIDVLPSDTRPLDIAGIGFSQPQLKGIALNLFCRKTDKIMTQTKAFGIKGTVNHIYAAGDYFFIDLGLINKTNLVYDIDMFRFKIDDKEVQKASNVQSIEVKPIYQLFDKPSFSKYYRNIFVFKKMSFPGNKVLHIELSEKQISGRVLSMNISYKDLLDADTIPLQ